MEAIVALKVQLEAATKPDHENIEEALALLGKLQDVPMTVACLKNTKIGKLVNQIRKHKNKTLSAPAGALLVKWKKAVRGGSSPIATKRKAAVAPAAKRPKTAAEAATVVRPKFPLSTEKDIARCGDKKRDRMREVFFKVLEDPLPPADAQGTVDVTGPTRAELATALEQALFKRFKDDSDAYAAKFRDLRANLKDSDNLHLNWSIWTGAITPVGLVRMDSSEMASPAKQLERQQSLDWATQEAQGPVLDKSSGVDSFECEKCGERNAYYFQQQTRGADEPMTVFVTCLECGNKWRDGDNAD